MIVVLADLQPYIFDGRAPAAANQGSLMETGRARKALSTYLPNTALISDGQFATGPSAFPPANL